MLIDTNIFIYRENEHVVPKNLQRLVVAFDMAGVHILVHPKSTDDISRDHHVERRKVILSKLGSYSFLESPPDPTTDSEFQARVGRVSTPNDNVDSAILYALYRDAVDYLVTEDKDLRKKSEKVGLGNRMLSVDQALRTFLPPRTEPRLSRPPALQKVPIHHLKVGDQFFDPLRIDYPEFEEWFKKISREGRQSFAYFREDGSLGASMILKVEDGVVDSNPPLPKKKRMKVALLKVDYTGHKIGELFVKLAVHDSIDAGCEELYLTHFVKPVDTLVDLIREYGFERVANNARGEVVFAKDLRPDSRKLSILHPVEVSQKYYPIFRDSRPIKKYLVPIRPEFHEKLFVDYSTRQTTLPEYRAQFIVEGNTIKKAYLCNSNNRTVSKGDIMLFYRSGDYQELTSIGVAESVYVNLRRAEEIAKIVGKRTVYSSSEIVEMLQRPTIVFLFTWHFYFPKPVTLFQLQQMGISSPQSITRITHQQYLEIKRRGGIDERFTVN